MRKNETIRERRNLTRKVLLLSSLLLVVVLLNPPPAYAYVGPGAGFAFLSSFLTLFLAFINSVFSFLVWPIRRVIRWVRRRKTYRKAAVRRVVIVGFDGMDPDLASRLMEKGKLPNFALLRDSGTFCKLKTTCPPISPVAWSTFLTGTNPGKHNIYDFLARDVNTYLPFLSSANIQGPKRSLKLGKYKVPIGKPQIKLLRHGIPFWHYLGKAGIFSSVIRVPVTFPPEKFNGVILSGMCVPDIQGSQGTFSFFTTEKSNGSAHQGGTRFAFDRNGDEFRAFIPGPGNPLQQEKSEELRIPFCARLGPGEGQVRIEIQGREFALQRGHYSEWVELNFKAGLGITIRGICRFYLKETSPHLELYTTPVNINPGRPALPISHPFTYSVYLSKLLGPYATLGLAEDCWALNEGVLDDQAFLDQCYLIHDERERMFLDALRKTKEGVCLCVFDITDRMQHMFWRYIDPDHPARVLNDAAESHVHAIENVYKKMDTLVGRVLGEIRDGVLLVVSDHGFKSFARGMNLNAWLFQNGYLALKEGALESREWFKDVDWKKTRAYAMGLNGLYVNQEGRELQGIVRAGEEAAKLKKELQAKLTGLVDSECHKLAVEHADENGAVFDGPYQENAPDLIIGYAAGYRASWDSVTGKVAGSIFQNNDRAWSGDHCIDHRLVPGVLFSNRRVESEDPAIVDVAPTILELFGIRPPAHFDGKSWTIANRQTDGSSSASSAEASAHGRGRNTGPADSSRGSTLDHG